VIQSKERKMNTRKLISPSSLTGALLVGLLSQPALATDEIVVVGKPATAPVVTAEHRADVERYLRTFDEQLRQTLREDLKRQAPPKVELASTEAPTRG
jgi:hypothetical protein